MGGTRVPSMPPRVRSLGEFVDDDMEPEPEFLLEPWLRERDVNMTYAPTGVGKSLFTMSIALAVAGGGELLGWPAPRSRRVLLVDGEMATADLRGRLRRLAVGVPKIDEEAARGNLEIVAYHDQPLDVRFPDLASQEGQEWLLGLVEERRPALVILDNYSTLVTVGDENSASSFNPVQGLLREIAKRGAAVILVHHSNKAKGSYRGTSMMGTTCNHIIRLGETPDAVLHGGARFKLEWEKFRQEKDERTSQLVATLGASGWTHEADEDGRLKAFVAMAKSGRYGTQKALAEALGKREDEVSRMRAKAIKLGFTTREQWAGYLSMANRRVADAENPEGDDASHMASHAPGDF